jgi:transposase
MRKGGTKRQLMVRLKAADRRRIAAMLRGGIEPVRVIKRAQVLRLLDQGMGPPQIADAVGVSPQAVRDVGWRYLGEGLDRALHEKPRPGHHPALSPGQAQRVVAMVCGPPPAGRARWSVRRIAEEARKRHLVTSVGRETIRVLLKQHDLKPWREKNLGRQSWLACLVLQGGQIHGWIASEAGAQGSCMTPLIQALAEIAPSLLADPPQLAGGERMQSGCGGSNQAHLAAQHSSRRGHLATRRTSLVVTLRPEQLLQSVVRAWQVRHRVAMEQARSVAAGSLAEMIHRLGQTTCKASVSGHGGGQAIEAALDHAGGLAGRIAEDMRDLVHPAVDTLDRRPEGGGVRQTAADQLAQPRERRCAAPFSATRSRLSATASSRALSFRPEAANGALPSSVIALRTAAQ